MLLVRTYLDKSPIHGIGVFAAEFIPRGTRVWEFTPGFDQAFEDSDLARLSEHQRETILHYGYREPALNRVVLCCDNAHHYNFSETPSTGTLNPDDPTDFSTYALRDIAIGDELTYPVTEDLDALRKLEEELYRKIAAGTKLPPDALRQ